jgi:ATP-binding cassette subfamily B protein/subfamily B ATP-binding cassette protein MsbA
MRLFVRALKEGLHHWPKLALALACSLVGAALWVANIGALSPIIQTTLNRQSLQDWNRGRAADAAGNIKKLDAQIAVATKTVDAASDGEKKKSLAFDLDVLRGKRRAEQLTIASSERLQPFLEYLPSKPFPTVLVIVSAVLLATILKQIVSLADTMLVSSVSQSIARDIRIRIFDKAVALDRPGFNSLGISGFSAYIMQTTEMLAGGITSFYDGALNEPLRVIGCLIGAALISWRLTLASLIFTPIVVFMIVWLNRRIRDISRRVVSRSRGFNHVMLEVFSSLMTVQAYTMEGFERERFRSATKEMRRAALRSVYYSSLASPITEIFGIGMLCTALGVAAYLLINQETSIFGITITSEPLSIPAMTVFFGLMIGAADPLRKLSGVITGINTGMAAAKILYPVLDQQSRIVDPPHPRQIAKPHRQIEFRNVGFSYDGSHYVLRNVNLAIPFGEHLAIIGPNGGGKSTLVSLLCRFFDPQEGEITIDGVPLKEMALGDLRGRIALVTQQTELFNETILHNIRYGCWTASDEAVIEAAKRAKAHDFISSFPEGYKTIVGPNGQRLSGGQRQRVALARAILRNAEILIMDEATSQIDAESERLIHDVLAELGQGRTMIMISHRESTLALARTIAQIDHGELRIIERGAARAA